MNITQKVLDVQGRILSDARALNRLVTLCDRYGHRFSGSDSLERSLDWLEKTLRNDGFDSVTRQPVMVPRWERGLESLELISPRRTSLAMLGLGGSVGTGRGGMLAPVVPVRDFTDLAAKAELVRGKVVLFNVPFSTYGATVQYRAKGAVAAAKVGAIASIVRSVGPKSLNTPHTGAMVYEDGVEKIPSCAVSIEGAELLQRLYDAGDRPSVRLKMDAHFRPDRRSSNVWADIRGSQFPDEVIAVGGHIDSWDVGQGANDDAGGCCAAWNALMHIKSGGWRPRRTIRVAFWVNEENGTRGGNEYAARVKSMRERHRLLVESDSGVGNPQAVGITAGNDKAFRIIQAELTPLLTDTLGIAVTNGGGGADISPTGALGYPTAGLNTDTTEYWNVHHTHADTVDKINPTDFKRCAAALATVAVWASESDASI
ncbi:MAG: M20/M25/M40 family metallo-hydrolase [Armatimonadota bacterium]